MKTKRYSFERSYRELSINDAQRVKVYIYNNIGMTSNTEFYLRKKSWKNIPAWCYDIIYDAYNMVGYRGTIFDISDE